MITTLMENMFSKKPKTKQTDGTRRNFRPFIAFSKAAWLQAQATKP